MKKKTIFIILAIILVGIVLISAVFMLKPKMSKGTKKDETKIVLQNKEDFSGKVEDADDTNKGIDFSEENTNNKPIYSNILVFDKEDGNISLYDKGGKLVDKLDLKRLYISTDVTAYESLKSIANEKPVFVRIQESDKLAKAELSKGFIEIYDSGGKIIKSVDLNEFIKPKEKEVVKKVDSTEEKDDKKVIKIGSNKKDNNDKGDESVKMLIPNKELGNKTLEFAVDTTFKAFKTIDDKLVFKDNARNALILITGENNRINTDVILSGIDLTGLTGVFVADKKIYLTFEEVVEILEISRTESGEITEDNIMRYELENVPSFAFEANGALYYVVADTVGRYNPISNEGETIDAGATVLDIHLTEKHLYIITEFGKDQENSVLIKVNIDDFAVEGIMELKGIYSKFIGFDGNIAHIRQKDSVKEIDIDKLKPLKAFSREGGIPIESYNGTFYKMEDGKVKVFSIDNIDKTLKEFDAEGFNFHFLNN